MSKDSSKKKIVAIVGQTATGKSAFAVSLGRKIHGEVISADSRQVYTGLNIGTGKITKREMMGVPHYLLDVASPKKVFTVTQFQTKADTAIRNIVDRGHVPIICGGTGFYIDTLLYVLNLPVVEPNKSLRKKLETKSANELFKILKKKDPERAQIIDRHNKVRLIRALEIIKAIGVVPKIKQQEKYDSLIVGLTFPDTELKKRIHDRLVARIKKGMIGEVKKLHASGVSWKRLHELGLEYRFVTDHLTGKYSREEMTTLLERAIWQYARRQKTWFKRNKNIIWINPNNKKEVARVYKLVQEHITKSA